MIVIGLVMGGNVLAVIPNSDSEKLFFLKMHMSAGMIILLLMVINTGKPPHADIGNTVLNKLGAITHYLFYGVVILMGGSGLAIAVSAGLPGEYY